MEPLHAAEEESCRGKGVEEEKKERENSLYRRYLLSTLPGTLPTPVCALWLWHRGRDLNPGAVTPSAAEGALLLVLLTLTRKLLDAVLGAAGTGWRPFAGKRQSRTKVPERESYRGRPKSRENRKEPDCQKKWQSQEGRQSPKKRKTVGKPENTGIRQHGKRWEGQERQRSPLLWSPLLWNPLLWDPDLPCLLRDGRNLLLASLLDIACGNLRVFLIGISCSGTELAFYTRGRQIPELLAEDLACNRKQQGAERKNRALQRAGTGRDTERKQEGGKNKPRQGAQRAERRAASHLPQGRFSLRESKRLPLPPSPPWQSLPARQEGLYRRSLETAGAGCPSI